MNKTIKSREEINRILNSLEYVREAKVDQPKGGQQTNGPAPTGCTVSHPDVNIKIFCGEHRDFQTNREDAYQTFKIALMYSTFVP